MKHILSIIMLFVLWSCGGPNDPNLENSRSYHDDLPTRTVYFIRHAKSSHSDSIKADFDRPLSKKGKSAAILMGEKMKERGIFVDGIVISPSKRTKSTAKRIAKGLEFPKDSIRHDSTLYRCKTKVLIEAVRHLDDNQMRVAFIGHNPSTIQAANHFQKDTIFTNIPTGGIVAIKFKSKSWSTLGNKDGKFLFFEYPKLYKTKKAGEQ